MSRYSIVAAEVMIRTVRIISAGDYMDNKDNLIFLGGQAGK